MSDHPDKVYRLRKALYGLKQAPRAWYDELSKFLTSKGFTKDLSGEHVDQTNYRSKIGSLMYLTSSRLDIVQAVPFTWDYMVIRRVSGFELKAFRCPIKRCLILANEHLRNNILEAEYVALSASCAQVMWMRTKTASRLWLHNQQNTVEMRLLSPAKNNNHATRAALQYQA
ncbi:retrovirus-related pol polyprotein from transposon TNT 1-94 [Tanacetum coccineum]